MRCSVQSGSGSYTNKKPSLTLCYYYWFCVAFYHIPLDYIITLLHYILTYREQMEGRKREHRQLTITQLLILFFFLLTNIPDVSLICVHTVAYTKLTQDPWWDQQLTNAVWPLLPHLQNFITFSTKSWIILKFTGMHQTEFGKLISFYMENL